MSNCTHSSTSDPFDCCAPEYESNGNGNSNGSSDGSSGYLEPAESTLASAIEEGRILGKQEGLLAGFREGRILGHKTGVDYGMEIGFAVGLASAVRNAIDENENENKNENNDENDNGSSSSKSKSSRWSSSSLDRIRKSVDELEAAIDAFPTSEMEIRGRLFRSESGGDDNDNDNYNDNYNDNDNDNDNENDDEHEQQHEQDPSPNRFQADSHPEDVRAKLQRIRARCKVLTAKLGIPRHSLKSVMAEAAGHAAATRVSRDGGGVVGGSRDW